MKCEMDENDPSTLKRSTQECNGTSRNLSFAGRRPPNSPVLGMAWLEIRRATAIDVNEVSPRERKLTIHWVQSDRPDSGIPYATFIFNFELSEQAMEKINNSILSNPTTPTTRSRLGIRGSSAEGEADSAFPSSPEITTNDIPTVENLLLEPISADTETPISSTEVAKGSTVKTTPENSLCEKSLQATSESVVENPQKVPNELMIPDHNNEQGLATEDTTDRTTMMEEPNGCQKRAREEIQPNAPEAKRLRSDMLEQNEEVPSLLEDVSDEEAEDYDSKIETIDTEIEKIMRSLKRMNDKKEFMEIKRKGVQSITDIKVLEVICGPLISRRPAQDKWDDIEGEDPDESGYDERRIRMEETLLSLEDYLTALKSKKVYLEKKAKLKRLKLDFEALEQRCSQISADITDMLSKSPTKTSSKTRQSSE